MRRTTNLQPHPRNIHPRWQFRALPLAIFGTEVDCPRRGDVCPYAYTQLRGGLRQVVGASKVWVRIIIQAS